jgi:hypothetical protein
MKNLKIIIITTTIAVLAVATIGIALAQNYGNSAFYGGIMGYSTPNTDDYWWTEMQERMEDHWNEIGDGEWWTEMRELMDDHWDDIQDEEWYNDMKAYMDEHLDEVENQPWFDEMTAYMGEQNFGRNYRYGYGCR